MSDPNYITKEGARRLQEELQRLCKTDRPKTVQEVADAAAQGDRSENAEYIYRKRQLREIDRRLRFLGKRLDHKACDELVAIAENLADLDQVARISDIVGGAARPKLPG